MRFCEDVFRDFGLKIFGIICLWQKFLTQNHEKQTAKARADKYQTHPKTGRWGYEIFFSHKTYKKLPLAEFLCKIFFYNVYSVFTAFYYRVGDAFYE
jgi:hypothetical protein